MHYVPITPAYSSAKKYPIGGKQALAAHILDIECASLPHLTQS